MAQIKSQLFGNNMKKVFYILITYTIVVFTACKKPYFPSAISSPGTYLVVEGVINSGPDSTIIKLSHTVNLASKVTLNPILNAIVTVESDQNNTYPLIAATNGRYVSGGLNLDITRKYRLRIKTADNKEYLSDYVAVVNSPPIDSVNFTIQSNGITIYSNTHDPKNNTRYYRWDYQETWVIHANYSSFFKSNGDTVLGRDMINDNIYTCWASDSSSTIILGSSAKLAKDVIVNNPVTSIRSTSEKLENKYSILVKQYALTGDAFTFWENLKKNTEQLGSIFDAQPSQINGNIHATNDPTEPVIGYLSVGNTSSIRIFIQNIQLPAWIATPAYPDCQVDTFLYKYFPPGSKTPVNQVDGFINYNRGAINPLIPITAIAPPGSPPIGYTAAVPICVDCTLRGTNKKPAFWK
jgi:hypothetical protein